MSLTAWRCPNGHLHHPHHSRCRTCGEAMEESIDLTDRTGEIVTWTVSRSTPPGVRDPNPLAIVQFEVDGDTVRILGGLTTETVESGDRVEPVYIETLREPGAGIRLAETQSWDGYRFRPLDAG